MADDLAPRYRDPSQPVAERISDLGQGLGYTTVRIQPPGIDNPNAVPAASMRTWREFHGDLTEPG